MATDVGGRLAIAAVAVLSLAAVLCNGVPTTLTLERYFTNHGANLTQLMARDRTRHGRMLSYTTTIAASADVVDFPVYGTYDPFLVGLYYTKVRLGNPSREFYVQIDTGSDAMWISCTSCIGCPRRSDLNISVNFYNPETSSTASTVSCTDPICMEGMQSANAVCSAITNNCGYFFQYDDASTTTGIYISDTMYLDKADGTHSYRNSSAKVVFGCSTVVTGDLTTNGASVDGIFGFGQSSISIISQLATQGITRRAFSHCLNGGRIGGGILVLGDIVERNMDYSPLVPDQPHYVLNLQSISVDGKDLNIDASVFETSDSGGETIIDSGTTLAYLAHGAYIPFITAIHDFAVSHSAETIPFRLNNCYQTNSSYSNVFPQVSFNFEGGSMTLRPEEYLLQQETASGDMVWCVGIGPMLGATTILGDIVLQNKIVVYDLEEQRIGWKNYDCTKSVHVETSDNGRNKTVVVGPNSTSSNVRTVPYTTSPWTAMLGLVFNLAAGLFMFQ